MLSGDPMRTGAKRITLFHALRQSEAPAIEAIRAVWPECQYNNLIDDSLTNDLITEGGNNNRIIARFLALGQYAELAGADGLLFTCAAFGPALVEVQRNLSIPVVRPNEAACEAAISKGDHIALMVTFEPAFATLKYELEEMGRAQGRHINVTKCFVDGGLKALLCGNSKKHDRLAAEAAHRLERVDAVIMGQFSLARALPFVESEVSFPVFTTPETAAAKMRRLVEA